MARIMEDRIEKYFKTTFLIIFVLLFVIQPFVKYCTINAYDIRLSAILKTIFLFIVIGFSFYLSIKKIYIIIFIILLGCFVIGQASIPETYSVFGDNFYVELTNGDIYITLKYLCIILIIGFFEQLKNKDKIIKKSISIFKLIISINTIFIILGIVFSISFFQSFSKSPDRFGCQGLLALVGESIYYYLIAIAICYKEYLKTKQPLQLIFVILGAILLGKKALFIFLFLFLLIHLWKIKKKWLLFLPITFSLLSIIFYKQLILTITKFSPFWEGVHEKFGIVSLIFSTRDIMFYECLEFIKNEWAIFNYFFGGGDFFETRSEFGFFDVFLNFGLVGFTTYLFFLKDTFLDNQKRVNLFVLISILTVEAVSGGLFINILPMLLFYFLAKFYQITD